MEEDSGVNEGIPKEEETLEEFSPSYKVPMVETLVEKKAKSKDVDEEIL